MKKKWKITLGIWIGIILFFGVGSVYAKEADLLLVGLRIVLLLAGAAYTLVIWLRDLSQGKTKKRDYHLGVYPKSVLRFIWDEPDKSERRERARKEG